MRVSGMIGSRATGIASALVTLTAALIGVATFRDAEGRLAMENAGRVINHKVAEDSAAREIGRRLRRQEPEVLIVGPSYANTDADSDVLAAQLGIPPLKVMIVAIPNSVGPHWFALLKHVVYRSGHQPRLVVLLSGLQSMLLTTPLTEPSWLALRDLLPEGGDPTVTGRAESGLALQWARFREQRGVVRGAIFSLARDLPTNLLFTGEDDLPMLPEETRERLDRVLADDEVDLAIQRIGSPILAIDREERHYRPEMLPAPEASFLAELTRLGVENGSRVVWARPPMSPFIPEELDDVVLPGVQERAIAQIEGAGGTYLDMRGLPMSMDMFKNEDHMNTEGSRRFTLALATGLLRAGGWSPVLPSAVTAGGVPAALMPGLRLTRDAPLDITLADRWDVLRGPLVVHVVVAAAPGSPAPDVEGFAAGMRPALTPVPENHGAEVLWTVDEAFPPPEPPWGLRLVGDGAVRSIAIGRGAGRAHLLGDARDADGARARLFDLGQVRGGVFRDERAQLTYPDPPPPIPGQPKELLVDEAGIAYFETPRFGLLSDERLMGDTNYGARCSPIRVEEDGAILPGANASCREVRVQRAGRSCHGPDRVWFVPRDDTDPRRNGRTYRLVLDPERGCDGASWVYPRDRFTGAFPVDQLATFTEPARFLTLGGRYINYRSAEIAITLSVDGAAVLELSMNGRDLAEGTHTFALNPPLSVVGHAVTLTVRNEASTFYLLDEATLSERVPP